MRKVWKIVTLFVLISLLVTSMLTAQSAARGRSRGAAQHVLMVRSNVKGASVFINGDNRGGAPLSVQLEAGTYSVSVRAGGYRDYNTNVTLNSNTTIDANLQPITYDLRVDSNVRGAQVLLNGSSQSGSTPMTISNLEPGTYTVTVRSNGYYENSERVNLNGNQSIRVNLRPIEYDLTVSSNVNGANVYINGRPQDGGTPLTIRNLSPGTYTILVKAKGYFDGNARVVLNQNQSVTVNIKPAMATIIPMKPHPDFMVFVDGKQITEPEMVDPGKHTVKYSIGALTFEGTYEFEAGEHYRIQPVLTLDIQQ